MSAPSAAHNPGAVLPQTEWPDILRATAIEVFATMVGVTVVAPEEGEVRILAEVTGMVGIAGPLRAMFSLRCSLNSATMLSSHMLGVPFEEAAAQKADAVGEICNIIAGYFKAKIGLGDQCSLSVPTVLSGTNYQIHSPGKTTHLGLPLLYENEVIWIGLDIRT
ncbi:MAG: chemotaxis protein CheX [Candidatus Sulfotelmatobacter sp.]|jgi:chemotaxis protein CheX